MECPRCFKEFDETEDNRKCPNCGYIADKNESFDKLKEELEDKNKKTKKRREAISNIPWLLFNLLIYSPIIFLGFFIIIGILLWIFG